MNDILNDYGKGIKSIIPMIIPCIFVGVVISILSPFDFLQIPNLVFILLSSLFVLKTPYEEEKLFKDQYYKKKNWFYLFFQSSIKTVLFLILESAMMYNLYIYDIYPLWDFQYAILILLNYFLFLIQLDLNISKNNIKQINKNGYVIIIFLILYLWVLKSYSFIQIIVLLTGILVQCGIIVRKIRELTIKINTLC